MRLGQTCINAKLCTSQACGRIMRLMLGLVLAGCIAVIILMILVLVLASYG